MVQREFPFVIHHSESHWVRGGQGFNHLRRRMSSCTVQRQHPVVVRHRQSRRVRLHKTPDHVQSAVFSAAGVFRLYPLSKGPLDARQPEIRLAPPTRRHCLQQHAVGAVLACPAPQEPPTP